MFDRGVVSGFLHKRAFIGGFDDCRWSRWVGMILKRLNKTYVSLNKNCHPERSRRILNLLCEPTLVLVVLMTAVGAWRRD